MESTWNRLRHRVMADEVTLAAAAVAFHAFLALVPLVFALLGGAALVGGDRLAVDRIDRALGTVAPTAVRDFLVRLLDDADRRLHGEWWVIAVSVAIALYLGSRAIVALQRALGAGSPGVAVRPRRSRRLVAVALTAAGGVSMVLGGMLLVASRSLFVFLAHWAAHPAILDLWTWLRIPVAVAGLFGFLLLCFRYAPPQPLPGAVRAAVLATVGIVLSSIGFGWYLSLAPRLGAAFGTLGAVGVVLVWLYLGSWSILAAAAVAGDQFR